MSYVSSLGVLLPAMTARHRLVRAFRQVSVHGMLRYSCPATVVPKIAFHLQMIDDFHNEPRGCACDAFLTAARTGVTVGQQHPHQAFETHLVLTEIKSHWVFQHVVTYRTLNYIQHRVRKEFLDVETHLGERLTCLD